MGTIILVLLTLGPQPPSTPRLAVVAVDGRSTVCLMAVGERCAIFTSGMGQVVPIVEGGSDAK
jgi:hypothetical protein